MGCKKEDALRVLSPSSNTKRFKISKRQWHWSRICSAEASLRGMETVAIRPMDFESKEGEIKLRTSSFKKRSCSDFYKPDKQDEVTTEESTMSKEKKAAVLPKPNTTWFSPKSIGELEVAATKVQKVYKSYRTRRCPSRARIGQ